MCDTSFSCRPASHAPVIAPHAPDSMEGRLPLSLFRLPVAPGCGEESQSKAHFSHGRDQLYGRVFSIGIVPSASGASCICRVGRHEANMLRKLCCGARCPRGQMRTWLCHDLLLSSSLDIYSRARRCCWQPWAEGFDPGPFLWVDIATSLVAVGVDPIHSADQLARPEYHDVCIVHRCLPPCPLVHRKMHDVLR